MFSRRFSNDLFAWGNGLLYRWDFRVCESKISPNGGQFWHLLRAFGNATINSFSTSDDGFFVFKTSQDEVYIGEIGTAELTLVPRLWSTSDTSMMHSTVFYDTLGSPYEVVINTTSGITIERRELDVESALMQRSYFRNLSCPFAIRDVAITASPEITRR
jgi:hypothetical protein